MKFSRSHLFSVDDGTVMPQWAFPAEFYHRFYWQKNDQGNSALTYKSSFSVDDDCESLVGGVYFTDAVFLEVVGNGQVMIEFSLCAAKGDFLHRLELPEELTTEHVESILSRWLGMDRIKREEFCILSRLFEFDPMGMSVPEMAEVIGMSVSHFTRACKSQLGVSPARYVREFVFAKARRLLIGKDGAMSLIEVAMECRFADQAHFCRAFKQRFGVTPGTYKKNMIKIDKKA